MKCYRTKSVKQSNSRSKQPSHQDPVSIPVHQNPNPTTPKQEVILQIPGCKVDLVEEGEAIELATGNFSLVQYLDDDIPLATVIRVGDDLQWPLTKDEPVVKLGASSYLFTLPMKDGDPLSYGVSFLEDKKDALGQLDSFLREHSCFSDSGWKKRSRRIDWKEFAPRIEDYNNVLAKAIAGGTGQIIRGIFICSNAYTNQVQRGGEMIQTRAGENQGVAEIRRNNNTMVSGVTKRDGINKSLKRVRNLSKMTEKLSKTMLDGVGVVTGSVMGPLVNSKPGKAFLSMVPGEVLLASLDAVNKILDAGEAAEKQALTETSGAANRMVSERYGESAGEATANALATAGHIAGTAWNVVKIRKAFYPSSTVSSGIVKNAAKNRN